MEWLWLSFLVVFLLVPVSYGWAYRGWGPPYPSYYRRRRTERGDIVEEPVYREQAVVVEDNTSGWGILADVLWFVFAIAVIWWIAALFW